MEATHPEIPQVFQSVNGSDRDGSLQLGSIELLESHGNGCKNGHVLNISERSICMVSHPLCFGQYLLEISGRMIEV